MYNWIRIFIFLIQYFSLCLVIKLFDPFTFKVITNKIRFMSTIWLFFFVFFVFLSLLFYSFVSKRDILEYLLRFFFFFFGSISFSFSFLSLFYFIFCSTGVWTQSLEFSQWMVSRQWQMSTTWATLLIYLFSFCPKGCN
jgi:hypothetical protein